MDGSRLTRGKSALGSGSNLGRLSKAARMSNWQSNRIGSASSLGSGLSLPRLSENRRSVARERNEAGHNRSEAGASIPEQEPAVDLAEETATRAQLDTNRLLRVRDNSILNTLNVTAIQERAEREALQGQQENRLQKFVHGHGFGIAMAVVILANAIQIGIESDDQEGNILNWKTVNVFFICIYVVEITLRSCADKLRVLKDSWFLFDAIIVLLSIVGMVAAGLLPGGSSVVVLRMMRLVKMVRIFRLFQFCQELWLLVASIATALKTVVWMWILLALVIYTFSILFCNELGHQFPEDDEIQELWGSIVRSCFTLFAIITLEGWVDIAKMLWDKAPVMVCVIIIFITVTTYAVMNVVMAVIVQNVVDRAIAGQEDELAQQEKELEQNTMTLMNIFLKADVNHDNQVSREEFKKAAECTEIKKLLKQMDIDVGDFGHFFDQIDVNHDDGLSVPEFVQGIMQMRGPARAKRVFELHCDFTKFAYSVEDRLRKQDDDLQEMKKQMNEVVKALNASGLVDVKPTISTQRSTTSKTETRTTESAEQQGAHKKAFAICEDGPLTWSTSAQSHNSDLGDNLPGNIQSVVDSELKPFEAEASTQGPIHSSQDPVLPVVAGLQSPSKSPKQPQRFEGAMHPQGQPQELTVDSEGIENIEWDTKDDPDYRNLRIRP